MLDEDEYFSLTANVTNPGYQRIALRGYLVQRRSDGTYIAPLIPQLFYGADGEPLTTWRQNLTETGEQVILSRSGGEPSVPRHELYWRKVSNFEEVPTPTEVPPTAITLELPSWVLPLGLVALAALVLIRK